MNSEWLSFLANHLWQSTVFAAAAGLLTLAFRGNRAPVRYGLWLAASLKFLVPISLLAAAAGHFAPPAPPALFHPAVLPAINAVSQPFSNAVPADEPMSSRLPGVLLVVWLGGAGIHLYGWSRRWLRMRAAARAARPLPVDAPIPVRSTNSALEPGVFGILRPVILLPESIVERLTSPQLDAILIHELCHVRRRDNLAAAVHMLVEALFWFHPLVWWIEDRMIEERERACDEEVLRQCADPESYADGILRVCRSYVESPLPCVSGVTGSDLKKRIEAIMTQPVLRKLHGGKKLLLAAAALACVAAPILISLANMPRLRAQSAAFEVISIKLDDTPGPPWRVGMEVHPGGRLHGSHLPLAFLIAGAYDVPFQSSRLSGLPDWASGEAYIIDAAAAPGAIPPGLSSKALYARIRPMLQAMLADRFKLVIRRETREQPVYAITVGKGAPKLKRAGIEEKDCTDDAKVDCHSMHGGITGFSGAAVDLDDVALFVSNWTDRPVVNRTGLTALYQFEPEDWGPITAGPGQSGKSPSEAEILADSNHPTILSAFNQLGLNLESAKVPVEMYVVEHVERPTAN